MRTRPIACHACGHSWSFEPPLGRKDECPKCGEDARVCKNCEHYDPDAHHECREPQAEWVKEKARGNFCGYFEPSTEAGGASTEQTTAKSQLEALFSGGPQPLEDDDPPTSGFEEDLKKFLKSKK